VNVDVIIVGAGPAGSSAALQIARRSTELAGRLLLLDAARFPRPKVCGGGVVRAADRFLTHLEVEADVPSVAIDTMRFEYEGGRSVRCAPRAFRVVRRDEFDACLVRAAQGRGVALRQGDPVRHVRRDGDAIVVATARAEYRARVVIGADGSNSLVRRTLVGGPRPARFVALEVVTPRLREEDEAASTAVFDFRPAASGLQGYRWDFPCLARGARVMNRGIGGAVGSAGESLKGRLRTLLTQRGIELPRAGLEGATAPYYDPALPQSAERVVLAGDAVGIDRWFGEGISVAIGTGILAAHAVVDAFERRDFSFADYSRRVRQSAVGDDLRRRRIAARSFYRAARDHRPLSPWLGAGEGD
jgi:geranylgeranyl reductase family protein